MSQLEKLKQAKTRKDLAILLGYKASALTSIIYKSDETKKYSVFEIAKKSGGTRVIKAPNEKLKKLQSHLSNLLYDCLEEIEKKNDLVPISFGFRKDRSIIENAARHKRRRWVLNIDLKDFFPSFNFGRVRGFFLKDNKFELCPVVATTIAQIACDGSALPQGSPCSPVISELIAQILDMRLIRLAKKYCVTYTRYADDISFSTNHKTFPVGLATPDLSDSSIWHLSEELVSKISSAGFVINADKTRMHVRGSRQTVTGLVVNDKVNIRSEYYRNARAMCNSLFLTGEYYSASEFEKTSNLNILSGILNHIYSVTQFEDKRDQEDQRKNPRPIRKIYRRFLFYKYFLANDAPLIVTEGKTDPVYLREALKSRLYLFPKLISVDEGKFNFHVKFFNYGGVSHEILGLFGGGSANLISIPLDYKRNLYPSKKDPKAILDRPMKYPVIIVVDNDGGFGDVASTIKSCFSIAIDITSTSDFYHITDNLYLIKTPENGASNTCIEDLFKSEILSTVLNGKKFSTSNRIDPNKEYSKEVFANSVVKIKSKDIDFSGFDVLLGRIGAAIEDHADKVSVK